MSRVATRFLLVRIHAASSNLLSSSRDFAASFAETLETPSLDCDLLLSLAGGRTADPRIPPGCDTTGRGGNTGVVNLGSSPVPALLVATLLGRRTSGPGWRSAAEVTIGVAVAALVNVVAPHLGGGVALLETIVWRIDGDTTLRLL